MVVLVWDAFSGILVFRPPAKLLLIAMPILRLWSPSNMARWAHLISMSDVTPVFFPRISLSHAFSRDFALLCQKNHRYGVISGFIYIFYVDFLWLFVKMAHKRPSE